MLQKANQSVFLILKKHKKYLNRTQCVRFKYYNALAAVRNRDTDFKNSLHNYLKN